MASYPSSYTNNIHLLSCPSYLHSGLSQTYFHLSSSPSTPHIYQPEPPPQTPFPSYPPPKPPYYPPLHHSVSPSHPQNQQPSSYYSRSEIFQELTYYPSLPSNYSQPSPDTGRPLVTGDIPAKGPFASPWQPPQKPPPPPPGFTSDDKRETSPSHRPPPLGTSPLCAPPPRSALPSTSLPPQAEPPHPVHRLMAPPPPKSSPRALKGETILPKPSPATAAQPPLALEPLPSSDLQSMPDDEDDGYKDNGEEKAFNGERDEAVEKGPRRAECEKQRNHNLGFNFCFREWLEKTFGSEVHFGEKFISLWFVVADMSLASQLQSIPFIKTPNRSPPFIESTIHVLLNLPLLSCHVALSHVMLLHILIDYHLALQQERMVLPGGAELVQLVNNFGPSNTHYILEPNFNFEDKKSCEPKDSLLLFQFQEKFNLEDKVDFQGVRNDRRWDKENIINKLVKSIIKKGIG